MRGREAEITVNIRNIAVGGDGVGEVTNQGAIGGELLGITAFVPFTIPGEEISATVVEEKKNYLKAQLLEIKSPSEVRIEARCEYFGHCGGCELQHMMYESQCDAKTLMIEGSLRAARLSLDVLDCLKPVIEGEAFSYRRRITLHVDRNGSVGFYRANSRSIVPITSCAVSVPSINAALKNIRDLGHVVRGQVSNLVLDADNKGVVAVLHLPDEIPVGESKKLLDEVRPYFNDVKLVGGGKELGGYGRQFLELELPEGAGMSLKIPAGSFSQVNWSINKKLISRVLEVVEPRAGKIVHDLYAGAGNFALPIAKFGATVTAVECAKELANIGRQNAERAGVSARVQYTEKSVERFLRANRNSEPVQWVIADPPRSGLSALSSQLGYAENLILISCHLPSFVRDMKNLIGEGWRVTDIQPFDMFAQTSYVEIMSVFERE